LTFCPRTGKINRNLLVEGLLIAENPGLAIFSGQSVLKKVLNNWNLKPLGNTCKFRVGKVILFVTVFALLVVILPGVAIQF
jgi:hypothetical protein